jgi:hypothetical protein
MHRNQMFWGVVLLLVGMLMLAGAMGITLPNGSSPIDLFWPVALVLAGLWVLIGVFFRGNVELQPASISLQGARRANLRINHGAGEMRLHGGASANELVRGTFAGGLDQKSSLNGDKLEVRMRPAKDILGFPFFFGPSSQFDWDVALNTEIPTELIFNLGANKSTIDLCDMNITDLKLETGASDTRLTLPSRGRIRADLDLGAASLEVIVPDGVSARIRASIGAADLKVDESRFLRSGNTYQSPDFETATNAADITIDAGAASIKVR